jgi:hypothetical protein
MINSRVHQFGPFALDTYAIASASNMVLNASGEMLGIRYWPESTSPITDVDLGVALTGTSPNFTIGVYAEASGEIPDTATPTQLGTDTPAFAWSASGFSGLKTLGTNTGNLTINQPVWIVLKWSSGTINSGNFVQGRVYGGTIIAATLNWRYRHHNGTNWTTTAAVSNFPMVIVKHADGMHSGCAFTANRAASAAPDIFVNAGTTQVQGIKFRSGSQIIVRGIRIALTKTGSPNDLTFSVYEGDTQKFSTTVGAAYLLSSTASGHDIFFPSPIIIGADTDIFILLSQTGTSDSNDYDVNTAVINSAYIDAVMPPHFRFVYGNGTVPSALTVSTTEFPLMWPLIDDAAADLDMAGGAGGFKIVGRGGLAA